jgi:CRP-like cAMP-binding protein
MATISATSPTGDVFPTNITEVLFCVLLMVFNLTLFQFIRGEVSTFVMRSDEHVAHSRSKLEAVDHFVKGNNLPKELQQEIRHHHLISQATPSINQHEVLGSLSYALKVEVACHVSRDYIEELPLFRLLSDNLLDAISVTLTEERFESEEYLYRQHEVATDMFIVLAGAVDEVTESNAAEVLQQQLRPGNTTGDVPFFFKMRHWVSAKASKVHGTTVLRLSRDKLSHLLKMHPKEEEVLAENAMELFSVLKDAATHKSKSAYSRSSAGFSVGSSKALQSVGDDGQQLLLDDDESASSVLESEQFDQVGLALGGSRCLTRVSVGVLPLCVGVRSR